EKRTVVQLNGPAAIRQLRFKISAEKLKQALRSTVLAIRFDGNRTVWAPIGDFFGTGYQLHPYRTWYTAVSNDGALSCAWVMPFEQEAEIELHNVGQQPIQVELCEAKVGDWQWDDRSMHFHSTWRNFDQIDTGGN